MDRSMLFLLASLVLLLTPSSSRAQGCSASLEPHFSVYTSTTRDGTTIRASVTIQGYATVSPLGCPQMNTATHNVGAQNVLGSTGGWNYSPSSCTTCYYSLTNNQVIVGVPGVIYPFTYNGASICIIAGTFWSSGGGGSLPGCLVPSTETTAVANTVFTTLTNFNQTIADTAHDSFNSLSVMESNAAPAQDTCWFQTSLGARYTGMTATQPWTVAGGEVLGQPNHWGYDQVGINTAGVTYYRAQAPLHGHPIPCGFTGYQKMQISCPGGLWATYTPSYGNKLTITIEQTDVINCRYDMNNTACQTINY